MRISRRPPRRAERAAESAAEGGGAVEQRVPAVPPFLPAQPGDVFLIYVRQLCVTFPVERVAIRAGFERGAPFLRGRPFADQLAEQRIKGGDEVVGAAEPGEHLARGVAEDRGQEHGALEVVERLAGGGAEVVGQLAEHAERRVEPAGHVPLAGERHEVVAEPALAEGEEVWGRRERRLRRAVRGDEERVGRALEQEQRVVGDEQPDWGGVFRSSHGGRLARGRAWSATASSLARVRRGRTAAPELGGSVHTQECETPVTVGWGPIGQAQWTVQCRDHANPEPERMKSPA